MDATIDARLFGPAPSSAATVPAASISDPALGTTSAAVVHQDDVMLDTRTFVAGGGVSEGAPGQHAPSLGADVMTVSAASLFDDTVASVAPPVAQAALNSLDGEHSRFLSGADWIRDFHPTHHLVSAHGLELLV